VRKNIDDCLNARNAGHLGTLSKDDKHQIAKYIKRRKEEHRRTTTLWDVGG